MGLPLLLAVLSGFGFGSWAVTLKLARDSKFENFFFLFVLTVLLLVSTAVSGLEGLEIFGRIAGADPGSLAWGLGGGVFWGLATLTFGYALTLVGLALGYAIMLGLGMFTGTSVSMFLMSGLPAGAGPEVRLYAMAGVLVSLAGVGLSSYAGHLKSRGGGRRDFKRGIPVCVLSGFLGSFFALGYAGAHAQLDTWSTVFLLAAGFSLVQMVFLGARITRRDGWKAYRNLKHNILYPLVGGVVFGLAVLSHYASADEVGVALAYPLMMGIQILSGNLWSFVVFREWRGAPGRVKAVQVMALAVLVIASVLIGRAMGFVS